MEIGLLDDDEDASVRAELCETSGGTEVSVEIELVAKGVDSRVKTVVCESVG